MEEQVAHLVFGQVLLRSFFNNNEPEIPVEIMAILVEMLVYGYCICSSDIISVLVRPFVHSLGLDFSDILSLVTF